MNPRNSVHSVHTRADEPIVLDGKPDKAAWEEVDPVPVVQYEPDVGEPATEKTEFLFTYDDEYFYAAVRAYDSNLEGIRSNILYRDGLSGDDHFEFMLDTYNDRWQASAYGACQIHVYIAFLGRRVPPDWA